MKLILYLLAIGLPMLGLALGNWYNYFDAKTFFILLMMYCLVYHPLMSGIRLLKGNQVNTIGFCLLFIPFWNIVYYSRHSSYLYFNRR